MKRSRNKVVETTGNRERYTRQYSFSSMCECAYCGHKLTRRTRHSRSDYEKPVWQCMNATKNGIDNCPNCKAVDEAILEGAFLDALNCWLAILMMCWMWYCHMWRNRLTVMKIYGRNSRLIRIFLHWNQKNRG